jgi:biopolymer transport protein ExbD
MTGRHTRNLFLGAAMLALPVLAACQPVSSFKADEAVVDISIASDGALRWNGEQVKLPEVQRRLRMEAARDPQPEIHVTPDIRSRYRDVAAIMAMVQREGLTNLGVVGGT